MKTPEPPKKPCGRTKKGLNPEARTLNPQTSPRTRKPSACVECTKRILKLSGEPPSKAITQQTCCQRCLGMLHRTGLQRGQQHGISRKIVGIRSFLRSSRTPLRACMHLETLRHLNFTVSESQTETTQSKLQPCIRMWQHVECPNVCAMLRSSLFQQV